MPKEYLGGGVYADFDGYSIFLTTTDGIEVTNTIILEPRAYGALLLYVYVMRLENKNSAATVSKSSPDDRKWRVV